MKPPLTNTRIKALLKQIETGKIDTDSAKILNYIKTNVMTSRPMIEDSLGMSHQTASARVSDLLDMGIIEVVESDADYEILKYQPSEHSQIKNARKRKYDKYVKWKKRGVEQFSDFLDLDQLEIQF